MVTQTTVRTTLQRRRDALRLSLGNEQALICSGREIGRNYPGNPYPFRASSHFLFLVGRSIPDAYFLSCPTGDALFVEPQPESDMLWHGVQETLKELSDLLHLPVYPLSKLKARLNSACQTLAGTHRETQLDQSKYLGRDVATHDPLLAKAMVAIRLQHDEWALDCLQESITLAAEAHAEVPKYVQPGMTENEVWARMSKHFTAQGFGSAYQPIITVNGEVLHGGVSNTEMKAGDLLLLDVGCEHPLGWASDISRTWPVSGRFSSTQSVIHEAVCIAQAAAIRACRADSEYVDVHMTAARSLTESLVDIGILRGSVDALFEAEVFAYFFPHGIGHLLGLDVHDMEDLGDIAGYSHGRRRLDTPGQRYLRLNRPLKEGMLVTIEPGFYQIPPILASARQHHPNAIDWQTLALFSDVRGIRIEDDVLITDDEPKVLSASAPQRLR